MSALFRILLALLLAASFGALARVESPGTDQVVVRLKAGTPLAQPGRGPQLAAALSALSGESLRYRRTSGEGAKVLRLRKRMPLAAVENLARVLARHGEVLEAIPDRIALPALLPDPDDPQYASQWALGDADGIRAPGAWDITTGSSQQVVAIVDTGLLNHADFGSGRILPGYDFVSDADKPRANDGDGRDLDPTDPGDWLTAEEAASETYSGCPFGDSSWHGTVVAGIIAAETDNGLGIAGINRNTKILPVRALGKCGGYSSDIADAVRWAAGFSVPEVPDNLNPADVINLSTSIPAAGACDAILQTAINEAVAANVPVIVAAGNQSDVASTFSPGNCANVITVGAVLRDGGRPAYANTGSPIALSAPGGTGPDASTAILATSDSGLTLAANDNVYAARYGTSIAAAHVTGVVSLMQAVKPTLTPSQVRDIVRNTSRAFPGAAATPCTTTACGQGIVDAHAAVQAALGYGNATPQVSAGSAHSGGARSDGTLWTWGNNGFGRLGDNSTTQRLNPVQVQLDLGAGNFTDASQVSLGQEHSLALRADGTGWAWGNNSFAGRLGDGTATQRNGAVQVCASGAGTCTTILSGITQVASGLQHSLALRNDGTVWAWGDNTNGQRGDGTTSSASLVPVQVCASYSQVCPTSYSGGCLAPFTGVIAIAAGDTHSLALKSDGTVWAWGNNGSGRLGDGTTTQRCTPVQVCTAYNGSSCDTLLSAVTAIAGGSSHSLALKSDGTAWGWGSNTNGQTGDGTTTSPHLTPVQALAAAATPLTGVSAIAAGTGYSMALKSDGTVWTWGLNSSGQLGNGSTNAVSPPYPAQPSGVSGVSAIGAGDAHALALKSDGTIYAWGANASGQVGIGATSTAQSTPTLVQAAGGGSFTLDLDTSAFIAQFGAPLESVRQSNTITLATGGAVSISAGGSYSVGCNGTFTSAAGSIANGQTVCVRLVTSSSCNTLATVTLTVGTTDYPFSVTTEACDTTPAPFTFLSDAGVPLSVVRTSNTVTIGGINTAAPISIAGGEHSIGCNGTFSSSAATIANGQTVCVRQTAAASNDTVTQATLTVGGVSSTFYVTTVVAPGFSTPIQVTGGASFTAGLRTDGIAFLWGNNGSGQLGDGTTTNRLAPQRLTGASGLRELGLGFGHTLARRADGSVWAWGYNAQGQLGDGSSTARATPGPVPSLPSGVDHVSAGFLHALALKSDGTVWAWGYNASGQLGDGTTTNRSTPVQVLELVSGSPLSSVVEIAAANDHSLARKADGSLWAWGRNNHGQLGDGTTTNHSKAVQVIPSGVAAIAPGSNADHALVLMGDGTVWSWGRNDSGQVGNGCTPLSSCADVVTPAQIASLTGVAQVAAGDRHSAVRKGDGSVWTWGYNANGQLGDGTTTSRSTPATVPGIVASTIGTGASHTLAVRPDGSVAAWGFNGHGQIGDGTSGGGTSSQDRKSPVSALGAGCSGTLNLDVNASGFTAQTDVAMSTTRCSNTIAITGIPDASAITVTGGDYQIESGAFTNAPGTINNGQALTLRQTSSAACATTTVATATINAATFDFSVTTVACDTTPDAFAFTAQTDVPLSSVRQSNTVTITGINTATPVSVSGGEYSVGCNGSFTSTAGTILPNETVCVRHTSAATTSTVTTTTLTVGGVPASFTSTTAPMRTLTVSLAGTGGGTVASTSPASPSINCGATCTADYLPDTVVTLQATPDASSAFAGWSGGCTGTGSCAVTMNAAVFVVATFNVVPPALQAAKSRKTHGGAGAFDLALDTTPPIGGAVSVEPRVIGTGHRIVFQFDRPITATGTAACVDAAAVPCSVSATASGSEVEALVTGLGDNRRATVSLSNVNGLGVNVSVSVAFATGDVNGTRSVTSSDILRAKGRAGATDATNFAHDVDLSGAIAQADVDAIKANVGGEP